MSGKIGAMLLTIMTVGSLHATPRFAPDIPDLNDTLTTVHLAAFWYGEGPPGSRTEANIRLTVTNRFGPSTHPPTYSGRVGCKPLDRGNPNSCPGRTGILSNIAIVGRGGTGRDGLVNYFDADATFETGSVCHFAGVTLDPDVSTLSSLSTCRDASGVAISEGAFLAHQSGPTRYRDAR